MSYIDKRYIKQMNEEDKWFARKHLYFTLVKLGLAPIKMFGVARRRKA